jgi:MFS family permease
MGYECGFMDPPAKYSSVEMTTVLIACCAGIIIMPLMSTMMNLALVPIGNEFGEGSKSLAMVNMVFLLGSVIVMVPLARLSDIIGRKKLFISGLVVTLFSAVIAIFSPTFEILLIMAIPAEKRVTTSPEMNSFFLPTMSDSLARGTITTTDANRKTVFTIAKDLEPSPNSLPIGTSARFIIVLIRGIIIMPAQQAMSTVVISTELYFAGGSMNTHSYPIINNLQQAVLL